MSYSVRVTECNGTSKEFYRQNWQGVIAIAYYAGFHFGAVQGDIRRLRSSKDTMAFYECRDSSRGQSMVVRNDRKLVKANMTGVWWI